MEALPAFLQEVSRTMRLADVFDVALAACFLYAFLAWVRRTTPREASRRLVAAGVVLAALYGTGVYFELFLVKAILQGLLVVLLLGALVLFQTDLRRMIDRLGTLRLRAAPAAPPAPATIDVLTEAAFRMAEMPRGALLVLRGSTPWDRHVEGGIPLGGRVSVPLLLSLFNPTSPGHDGAVLIEGERVTRFAAHLPLSTHLPQVSQHGGTRHAAAVGLSEQCDALVVVVSEERGVVSLAEHGVLREVASPGELKAQLVRFWNEHYARPAGVQVARRRRIVRQALLSTALAVLLWFTFAYRPARVVRTYNVPIEFRNLAPVWGLQDPPSAARVSLSGSEQAFRQLDPATLSVSFDVGALEDGLNEMVVAEDNLRLPPGVALYDVDPQVVTVTARRLRTIEVPVQVPTVGTLPDTLQLAALRPSPATVTLLVQEGVHRLPTHIRTEPVDLSDLTAPRTVRARLIPPDHARLRPEQDPEIEVAVELRRRTRR